jgi:hypothetical protein
MKLNSQNYITMPFLSRVPELILFPNDFIFTNYLAIEVTPKLIPRQCPDMSPKLSRVNCRQEY